MAERVMHITAPLQASIMKPPKPARPLAILERVSEKQVIPWATPPQATDLFSFDHWYPNVVTCLVCPGGRQHRLYYRSAILPRSASGGVKYYCHTLLRTRETCRPLIQSGGYVFIQPLISCPPHWGGALPSEPSRASDPSSARPWGDVEAYPVTPLACAPSGCLSADRDAASRGLIADVLVRSTPCKEHKAVGGTVAA